MSRTAFSSSFDRARLGDYTVVLKTLAEEFLICYVFTGSSYYAIKKISAFVNKIQDNQSIWHILSTMNAKNGYIENIDKNSLDEFISDSFILGSNMFTE